MNAKAIFRIALSHRIWRVTLDGAFFGDYRSKQHAQESAREASSALAAAGREASIVVVAD